MNIEKLSEVLIDEGRLGILLALSYYDSLNMSHLAHFNNKTRPTVTHHIKILQRHKLMGIDNDNALKAGKYFKLSSKVKTILSMNIEEAETKQIPLDYQVPSSFEIFAKILKTTSSILKNITHSIANYFIKHQEELASHSSSDTPYPVWPISTMTYNLKIYSDKQKEKFLDAFKNLYQVMKDIEEENNEKQTGDYDVYFMHSFTAPISKVDPKKKVLES